jgi:hypothetical protein
LLGDVDRIALVPPGAGNSMIEKRSISTEHLFGMLFQPGYTLLQQGDFPAREIVVLEMTTFTDTRVFSGVGPPLNGNL